jgi:GNAT superfamily N-acetyltransferase
MTISVRPARFDVESQELIDTLQTNLPHLPHARLFPWLYLRNPEGRALAWVAIDPETDRMIGVAAAFPRRVYFAGGEVRSYVLGDFCIDSRHRSLGLALALQRACLEGISTEDSGFAVDFPSRTMLAVYKRLQIDANATMIRYAKPLRADRRVAERVPFRAIARGLTVVANAGLRLRDNSTNHAGRWMMAADSGPWGEEFTRATREWSPGTGICVARTADYLNWRYREHPEQSYEMLTAREEAMLCGYLVFHMNGEDCTVDDLCAGDDAARSALLGEATAVARRRRVHTLSAPWLSTHPGRHLLEKCGFRPRESSPVVLMTLPRAMTEPTEPSGSGWYLTHGDWES